MERTASANVIMSKEKPEKITRSARRTTPKRKAPTRSAEGAVEAKSTEELKITSETAAMSEDLSVVPGGVPLARAKRTRSPTRKARASKTNQLVAARAGATSIENLATVDLAAPAATSLVQLSEADSRALDPKFPKRTRRGRRRRRDEEKSIDEDSSSKVEAPKPEAATTVELPSESSEPVAVPIPTEPVIKSADGPPRDRRRRRGRRGRSRDEDDGLANKREEPKPIVGKSRQPDVEVVFDDDFPLDEEGYDFVGSVELEGEDELDVGYDEATPEPSGTRQMMINVSAGTECRIAILNDHRLEEFFIERDSSQSHVGNIYKGRVTNVEPSIQAAFVDFGLEKNGFLHISDVQPQYFPDHSGEPEDVGRKIPRHLRPPIQRCFRRGQEVIVQITKEGVGTKGPTLTSYLSIPGRFLVMMPGMSRHGVSRKIEDEAQRREMRDMMAKLDLPNGMGFIMRTAGLGRDLRELQRDLNYLVRLWKSVVERIKSMPAPAELYRESDLVTRTIRDIYNTDFERIVIDDETVAKKVSEFLHIAVPRSKTVVEHYSDREPLFHRFGIEAELERINMRHVPLRSGGSLVIDSTEAMVAIDVNSGRFRTPADAEETALQINIEAAEEIARQLRLRDLGGLIVCDFIDMRHDRNKRKVENALRDALKKHKERARILRMSAFGLIEMTRQRQGPSLRRNLYTDCPECRGTGHVKLPESVTLDAMRMIQFAAHNEQVQKIVLSLSSDVAFRLLNQKRDFISQVETETKKAIIIHGNDAFTSDQMEIACEDSRGRPVTISAAPQVLNNGRSQRK